MKSLAEGIEPGFFMALLHSAKSLSRQAVIGGLLFSMVISLFLVPLIYKLVIGNKKPVSISLDPDDETSKHYDKNI